MQRSKTLLMIGGAVAAAGIGAWALRGQNDVQYRTARAGRGDVAYAVSATGTPNAVVTVQVGSQVSGNIQALFADFNTRVTKGQVVARIVPDIFDARVEQAKANLSAAQAAVANSEAQIRKNEADVASAKAAVADARANIMKAQSAANDAQVKLGRRLELVNQGILSREDRDTAQATYDQAQAALEAVRAQAIASQDGVTAAQAQVQVARTQLASAQAQVRQSEAALRQAQVDLDNTYIRAPVDGVVVARSVDVGQTVAASMQAPTLFQIAQDLTRMQVDTNVSEADVGRVRVGQPATFTVDAYPGEVFQGRVDSIRKAPINVQNVVTYDVVLAVSNPDLKLFPGMTANVKILIEERKDVLRIPNAALRYRPAGEAAPPAGAEKGGQRRAPVAGEQTVWVLNGKEEKPHPVRVSLGLGDGTYTEVAGGDLREGDQVVVAAFGGKEDGGAASGSGSPFGGSGGGRSRGPRF